MHPVPSDTQPLPTEKPASRRELGAVLTQHAHLLNRRKKIESRYNKRIAKLRKRAVELEEERDTCVSQIVREGEHLAKLALDYVFACWDKLVEKGTRTIRLGTGEIRRRDVGTPTLKILDANALHDELARKGAVRKFGTWKWSPNLKALQNDIPFAQKLKNLSVVYDEKIEFRPVHAKDRFEASIHPSVEEYEFYIPEPAKKARG